MKQQCTDPLQSIWRKQLAPYLPEAVNMALQHLPQGMVPEEIRLRAGQPMQVCFSDGDRLIGPKQGCPLITAEDCAEVLRRITDNSLYAWADELRQGFLTLAGGYRVGIVGRAVLENGRAARISDITGLCIRIARSCCGAAYPLLPYLKDETGLLYSTLIVSPPCAGKTTLLRDLIRAASAGDRGLRPGRVCVADSRYELSGSVRGVPQFDLGPRTDVLSGCTKAEGMRMLLMTMSPEILAADELAAEEDLAAVTEAAGCGVRVLASVHSGSVSMLRRRSSLQQLLCSGLFERYVLLSRRFGAGTVEGIYDADFQPLMCREQGVNAC